MSAPVSGDLLASAPLHLVNMDHVCPTRRVDTGRLFVRLRIDEVELPVSRAYARRFRQM